MSSPAILKCFSGIAHQHFAIDLSIGQPRAGRPSLYQNACRRPRSHGSRSAMVNGCDGIGGERSEESGHRGAEDTEEVQRWALFLRAVLLSVFSVSLWL